MSSVISSIFIPGNNKKKLMLALGASVVQSGNQICYKIPMQEFYGQKYSLMIITCTDSIAGYGTYNFMETFAGATPRLTSTIYSATTSLTGITNGSATLNGFTVIGLYMGAL